MLEIEAIYGKPITVFKATHGVKTVTPRLSRPRAT